MALIIGPNDTAQIVAQIMGAHKRTRNHHIAIVIFAYLSVARILIYGRFAVPNSATVLGGRGIEE